MLMKLKRQFISWFSVAMFLFVGAMISSACFTSEKSSPEWPEVHSETKPWTRWWWLGNAVTESGITQSLEMFKDAGLGGVEITSIYGVRGQEEHFVDFLSPRWMELFVHTLEEAQRLGLGVDLANASGWPFGGPWVEEADACKTLSARTWTLGSGERLAEKVELIQQPVVRTQGRSQYSIDRVKQPVTANENLQECAFDQIRYPVPMTLMALTANRTLDGKKGFGESVDLTNRITVNGFLDWTAPEGSWLICALFMGNHGKMVERAGPGGEGNVIDHFSEKPLQKYLDHFDQAFKGYDVSGLRYYFNDSYEVDDAFGEADWTPMMFEEFAEFNGYDLRAHLPALLGRDTPEQNARVIYDYRMTVSRLLAERYTRIWQAWASGQGKGIRNQAHGSPANVLDLYGISDVPEIEGIRIENLKSAPSAAHVTGKNLVSSESCTWLGEHFESTLGDVKQRLDRYFLGGVNHIFYHGTAYSPIEAAWPGWLFYASEEFTPTNSYWDDFSAINRYVARIQSFMQRGRPSNDILLYYGVADWWSEPGRTLLKHTGSGRFFDDVSLMECGEYLLGKGYSWDAISDDQLQGVTFCRKRLETGGNSYRTVLVPFLHLMSAETAEKLVSLAESGATILFYKQLPEDVPGLKNLDQDRQRLQQCFSSLTFADKDGIQEADCGKGRIVISDDLDRLVASAGVGRETLYDKGLLAIRRKKEDGGYYYFIRPEGTEHGFEGWVHLQDKFKAVAVFNPMNGLSGMAKIRNGNEFYLQCKPGESLIVETFHHAVKAASYPFYNVDGDPIPVTGAWDISFVKGGPSLPPALQSEELNSWTELGAEYVPFSGSAEYRITLPELPDHADAWRLDLGDVKEHAAVWLDGEYVGTIVEAPFTIDISADRLKGEAELMIRVSNLMANRIMDMDKKGIAWRIFYNTNFNARKRENLGPDGKFTAAGWEPRPSGLLGPVVLTALHFR